jgi:hypothetical protein
VVAIQLALVNLSTYGVILCQETRALLQHSGEELHLAGNRSLQLPYCSRNCGISVPQHVKIQAVGNSFMRKIGPMTPLHERPAQTVTPC